MNKKTTKILQAVIYAAAILSLLAMIAFIVLSTSGGTDDGSFLAAHPAIDSVYSFIKTTPGYLCCIFVPFIILIIMLGINAFLNVRLASQAAEIEAAIPAEEGEYPVGDFENVPLRPYDAGSQKFPKKEAQPTPNADFRNEGAFDFANGFSFGSPTGVAKKSVRENAFVVSFENFKVNSEKPEPAPVDVVQTGRAMDAEAVSTQSEEAQSDIKFESDIPVTESVNVTDWLNDTVIVDNIAPEKPEEFVIPSAEGEPVLQEIETESQPGIDPDVWAQLTEVVSEEPEPVVEPPAEELTAGENITDWLKETDILSDTAHADVSVTPVTEPLPVESEPVITAAEEIPVPDDEENGVKDDEWTRFADAVDAAVVSGPEFEETSISRPLTDDNSDKPEPFFLTDLDDIIGTDEKSDGEIREQAALLSGSEFESRLWENVDNVLEGGDLMQSDIFSDVPEEETSDDLIDPAEDGGLTDPSTLFDIIDKIDNL